ncbi:hypothetical protein CAOG_08526 [Capsaspora owczarzaki ATCC 30864]|uniref:Coiled-coil domain-containing protein 22 homolog n=1 Tax=Capsaspora owczarzaki (strain ATCC 30864) TaxID=595528 RepID=A0A0D2U508_CAPO3|nr:hypothetical protein CAOG_08526 [Capsaspora owczarzaki ATCC 30864]KJE90241.1 hypothetical protein CAOG_008526 [Capsaspora owczarzaki ATCC 30864]|eukprot:XP_011270107.1 hypothetical protein CAOG_08526 [Capsaspora owczarzaki ATCC 30864]
MEEVDNIIIVSLRSIGCDIPDDVASIKAFSTDIVVDGAATALATINEKYKFPRRLPNEMSARFRICTNMANACKELGYADDIGYHQFLYSNESEVRKLFMWLVEKLPRESSDATAEPTGVSAVLNKAITDELEYRAEAPWTLPVAKRSGYARRVATIPGPTPKSPPTYVPHQQWEGLRGVHRLHASVVVIPAGAGDVTKPLSKELRKYYAGALPYLTAQPPVRQDVAPSILEKVSAEYTAAREWEEIWNKEGMDTGLSEAEFRDRKRQFVRSKMAEYVRSSALKGDGAGFGRNDADSFASFLDSFSDRGLRNAKGSRFTHAEKFQFTQDEGAAAAVADTEEELRKRREEELRALQERLDALSAEVDRMEHEIRNFNVNTSQLESNLREEKSASATKEALYRSKVKVFELLPEADKNIELLQGLVSTSTKRLVELATKWEAVRAPLVLEYRTLKESQDGRMTESRRKLAQIKEFRESMKQIAEEARIKDELYRQLTAEYEKMTKDINRSIYTRRILEIVKNIKKQREDIDKVLIETRALQKEINHTSDVLNRTFSATDELIFKDAKKDDACRRAYKYLASLHEHCNVLIADVENTGKLLNEIRDFEEKLEQLNQQNVLPNLERITADYIQVKKENQALSAKLSGRA